ncbi:hypothetical protein [Actinomadura hibisca]|uniref:hypothetical protein n=1 Tax=Actinomadura hibisca TaxID=68565 RepID=UPI00082CC7FC|nr:hypothetical protein [Actinomadura hibisca]
MTPTTLSRAALVGALATALAAAWLPSASADGVRISTAAPSAEAGWRAAARMCEDPRYVGAIRIRNPLGLYDVECVEWGSARFPGPRHVTHCAITNGGYMNLHLRDGGAFECPGTLDAWIIGYSAWHRKP